MLTCCTTGKHNKIFDNHNEDVRILLYFVGSCLRINIREIVTDDHDVRVLVEKLEKQAVLRVVKIPRDKKKHTEIICFDYSQLDGSEPTYHLASAIFHYIDEGKIRVDASDYRIDWTMEKLGKFIKRWAKFFEKLPLDMQKSARDGLKEVEGK